MKRILPFLILPFFISSCFHKDVMNDRADDVTNSFIYTGKEGSYIITKEEIFQATSKSSGGGFTRISGYSEYRLTAYSVETGELTGRVEMGEGQEESCEVLGATPGKIWVYSLNEELGLHCRNPKTLEVISTEKQLTAAAPLNGFAFARPEWMKLNQHYGWNAANGFIMLTDMQGFHYYFDTEKNTLTKTEDEIPDYDWSVTKLSSTGYFSEDDYVSISQNGRQKLTYRNEDSTGTLSYLNAELIMDCNPLNDVKRLKAYLDSLNRELAAWNDSVTNLKTRYPELDSEKRPNARSNYDLYKISWKLDEFKRKQDDINREIKNTERSTFEVYNNPVLSEGGRNFYLLHATDVSDTSRLQVSKINLSGRKLTEVWTSRLPDFYRDAGKADSKGAFETVFSEGNPEFDYEWYEIFGDKLIFISQLQMICIDVKTGKTLWQHPI